MNYFKKLLSFCVMVVLTVGLVGCGTKSPSKVVSESLDAIKNGDNTVFSDTLNSEISNAEDQDDSTQQYSESMKKVAESIKNITYNVNSETIDGDNATVNVTVTGPDMADVFSQFLQKAFADAFSQAFSGQALSEEETNERYDNILSGLLDNAKDTDRTMNIDLVKDNGEWKIKDEDQLVKLVLNLDPDALKNLSGNDASDKSDKKEVKEMTLNVPFTVETKSGNYNLTIEGAHTTDERNQFSDITANKVVVLDYSYENISFGTDSNQDLYIDGSAFQVLDDEGNVLDTYPVSDENRIPKATPVGGKSKGAVAYALNTDSKNLNVTFKRGNEKVAKIVVPIQ